MPDPLSVVTAKVACETAKGLGIGKLTSPTFEYLGFKLRDTIRSWMSSKVKERAALRRAEVGFLYRQLDLLDYGNDQYAAYLESMTKVMLDRHFDVITPLAKQVVAERKIPPERSMEIFMQGFSQLYEDLEGQVQQRERPKLEGGELILYTLGSGVLDVALAIQSAKMLFHFTHMPAAVHLTQPDVPDEVLEQIMGEEDILKQISEGMETDTFDFSKRFVRFLHDAYNIPFDEVEYEKNKLLPEGSGED